jgi:hypothetical protein
MGAGLAVLSGEPGLGKTFTVRSIAERLAIPAHYYEARRAHGKTIETDLLLAIGVDFDPRDLRVELQDRIVEACQERRVIMIDEADRIGEEGIDILRYVWTQGGSTAFVFVGHKVDRMLAANPALDSRIECPVRYQPLSVEDTVAALPEYHDVYRGASEGTLVRLHALTGGSFRRIAQLTRHVLMRVGDPTARLTRQTLEQAWNDLGREPA